MKKIQMALLSVRLVWVFFYLLSTVSWAQEGTSGSIAPATIPVETAPATAEAAPLSEEDLKVRYILCKSGKSVRTVRVAEESGSACSTYYTKGGVDKRVGGSKEIQTCVGVLKSIQKNIESGGWKCKDITASSVTEPASSGQ